MSEGSAKLERGLTAKALIVGGLVFIFSIATLALAVGRFPWAGSVGNTGWMCLVYLGNRWDTGILGVNFIFIPLFIIIAAIQLIHKKLHLTAQEWTIVFAITAMIWPMLFWVGVFTWAAGLIHFVPAVKFEDWGKVIDYVPDLWIPKDPEVAVAYYEAKDVTWIAPGIPAITVPYADAWAPSVTMWVLFGVFIALLTYGLSLIFKRVFVDIEKLPFPCVYPNLYVVQLVSTPAKPAESGVRGLIWSRKALWFWIGFIASFLIEFLRNDGYGLPFILREMPYSGFDLDVNFTGAGKAYIPLMWWNFAFTFGLALLFPLDVLLGGIVFYLIFHVIAPYIAVYVVGMKSPGSYGFGDCWAFWEDFHAVFLFMWIGIALFTVWNTKEYWMGSLRAFLRGGETAEGEPCSYRTMWILFLVGFIGLIAWMLVSGIHPWMAFIVTVYIVLAQVAWMRIRGEAWQLLGIVPWGWRTQHTVPYYTRAFAALIGVPTEGKAETINAFGPAAVLAHPLTGGCYQPWSPVDGSLHSYKMASETKTDPRDVFKAQLPTLILGIIIVTVLGWMVVGASGVRGWWASWTTGWDGCRNNIGQARFAVVRERMLEAKTWGWGLAGIIIAVVLMYARMRFPWFPINVIGAAILNWTQVFGMLVTIVAWVVKLITLKIGGTKVYEDILTPLAAGMVLGGVIVYVIIFPIVYGYLRVIGVLPI